MNRRTFLLLSISLLLCTIFLQRSSDNRSISSRAYIEPDLTSAGASRLSVIVATTKPALATRAIEQMGGQVTSDLWLIDSLATVIPADQLSTLARTPGVSAIVRNKAISAADHGSGGRQNRNDWVSDRRRTRDDHALDSRPKSSPVLLPDGGVVLVTEHGQLTILNADSSLRAIRQLSGGEFVRSPIVTTTGIAVVAGDEKEMHAVAADGTLLWTFTGVKKFKVGAVIDEANSLYPDGVVYAVDEEGNVSALNLQTGALYWSLSLRNLTADDPGKVKGTPVVGPNHTLYIVAEKGVLFALSPQGSTAQLNWMYQAQVDHFEYDLIVNDAGQIYLPYREGVVAVSADGSLRYQLNTEKDISAAPVVAGSVLLVPAEKHLYAVEEDGRVRFRFESPAGGKFESSPVVSPDLTRIYAPLKEKQLYAIDAVTGQLVWSYNADGELKASAVVESNGDIHLGTANGHYTILSPEGHILYQTRRSGDLRVAPILSADEETVYLASEAKVIEAVTLMPDVWNGTPDVQATGDRKVWQFASPVTIDVGADVLHDPDLAGGTAVTGDGVTVAVIDSGVYFDSDVKAVLGSDVEQLFLGQADFTGDGLCAQTNGDMVQQNGYCWSNHKASIDPYGHGSHVAGIIWNHFTDLDTGVNLGIAPGANILSVRVLGPEGQGTYEDVIQGIQYAVANQAQYNIRVLNVSLSAPATTPYFADPLNQAVEAAWAQGIVVLAAAGNEGPSAQSITVPGNDPYVVTVGAVDSGRTAGYWGDDTLPGWSSTGPTLDGFIKPDILAPGSNVVSFMYNDPGNLARSAYLVQHHPDYSETMSLFRMNGTSMATAVASGVVSLLLEAHPQLTPDQVKDRLMATARTAVSDDGEPIYSVLQQGAGRIWVPDAVLSDLPFASANAGLDIQSERAHLWQPGDDPDPAANPDLLYHFQGPVYRLSSGDGLAYNYFIPEEQDGRPLSLGVAWADSLVWIDRDTVNSLNLLFGDGQPAWANGYEWAGGAYTWSGGTYAWSGGTYAWSGGTYAWSGGTYAWSGGTYAWSGGTYAWSGGTYAWSGGTYAWSGGFNGVSPSDDAELAATIWIDD